MRRLSLLIVLTLALTALSIVGARSAGQKFFRDDPLKVEPETADASHVTSQDVDLIPDLILNLFTRPGDPALNVRAKDISTIDEVPDSSWFTNRNYGTPLTLEQIARGPDTSAGPAPGHWTVTRAKVVGFAPGFTAKDSAGETWFLEFDPKGYPHASTAAVLVATKLFWALGYYQVESHISSVRLDQLDIDPKATVSPRPWRKRQMTHDDIEGILRRAQREPDGSYRVVAGRLLPGKIVGPFKYYGTRHDDPNDLIPHEHRRSLRALKVFGAWINLNDMKAGNTLDTVVEDGGRHRVRHYLQDVGSTFGAGGNGPREWDEGYEYVVDLGPTLKRLASIGFYVRPWQTVPYKVLPEVGRFEGDRFDPEAWVPRVPTPAFVRARPDDTFWAALRVMAFSDEQVRAAVHEGQFADPAAERLLGDVMIKRRDAIGRAYLPKITPLTDFALAGDGTLTFRNVAVELVHLPQPDGGYRAEWSTFDNATSTKKSLGKTDATGAGRMTAPGLPDGEGTIVEVALTAPDSRHPTWSQPIDLYFRRSGGAWQLVGVERLP